MNVKVASKSATVAWSPLQQRPGLLAAATVSGADAFSAPSMDIFSVDLSSAGRDMAVLGSVPIDDRVERLSWGTKGVADGQFRSGLIAGGMVDGTVAVWDAEKILTGAGAGATVLLDRQQHAGPVKGCQFNPHSTHLLATGSVRAELAIWDLTNPTSPSVFKPEARSKQADDVSHLAWNCNFQHILATTAYDGVTVVWDLKVKRPVIAISDTNRRISRCSSVAWNPEDATKLMVASEDDNCPVLQLWDLRKAFQPLKELSGHGKGVLSMSWCPLDPDMLLSCGKDARNILWDPNTGEVLSELPSSMGAPSFDVQWSPGLKAIVSGCAHDGKVSIHSLQDGTCAPSAQESSGSDFLGNQQQAPAAAPLSKRAPKWLKRPAGATFGFGGQLCSFGKGTGQVKITKVVTDTGLISKADSLETALSNQDYRTSLLSFCDQKLASAPPGMDQDTWNLLKLWFVEEPRSEMLKFIGFQPPERKADDTPPPPPPPPPPEEPPAESMQSAEDLFGSLAASAEQEDTSLAAQDEAAAARETRAEQMAGQPAPAAVVPSDSWESAPDGDSIKRALIVGDYETAVECCLRAGRTADALVLAASKSEALWQKTRDRFLAVHKEPFMKTVASIKDRRLDTVVDRADLSTWQETLAILLTFADQEQISTLAEELGARLDRAGDTRGANICYVCAGSVEKACAAWAANLPSGTGALQELIEKVCVFQKSTGLDGVDQRTAQKYCEYAETLAAQGRVDIAMKYMQKAAGGGVTSESTAILVDRLYHNGAGAAMGVAVPPSPYASSAIGAGQPANATAAYGAGAYGAGAPAASQDAFWPNANAAVPAPQPQYQTPGGYSGYSPAAAAPAPPNSYQTFQPAPVPAPAPAPAPPPFQTFNHGGGSYTAAPPAVPPAMPMPAPVPAPAPPPFQTFNHGNAGASTPGPPTGGMAPPTAPAGPPTVFQPGVPAAAAAPAQPQPVDNTPVPGGGRYVSQGVEQWQNQFQAHQISGTTFGTGAVSMSAPLLDAAVQLAPRTRGLQLVRDTASVVRRESTSCLAR